MKYQFIESARQSDNREIWDFDSISEYVEFLDEKVPATSEAKVSPAREWNNYQTWQGTVGRASTGNREMTRDLYNRVDMVATPLRSESFEIVRDVTGDFFDVGEHLAGEPECFRSVVAMNTGKPVVQVCVNFAQASRASAESLMNRGAAIVALCDVMENEGFYVDLKVVAAAQLHSMGPAKKHPNRNGRSYARISVQTRPLDLDAISYCIINPAFLRRLYLGLLEYSVGLYSVANKASISEYDLEDAIESGFYFGSTWVTEDRYRYRSVEAARKHVLEMIEKYKENRKVVQG